MILAIVVACAIMARRRWWPSTTAFGTAHWATEKLLRAAGMLSGTGLILGRTRRGFLIRIPRYTHVLLTGGTGSGKGIGVIIPNLLTYTRGSLVVFDTKGDLFAQTARRRQRLGQRVLRLSPFGRGDTFNPCDTIPADSPLLCDHARAMAESLVVRQGTESDPHWNDKSAQVITALLVFVLTRLSGPERSLNSVQEIASDPELTYCAAIRLQEAGGIPARMANQLKSLFEKPGVLRKEGAGVFSTVARHLSFLDSESVARSVAVSSFDVKSLLKPGVSLYLQIPPDQLEAQRGLLRCWVSTLIRVIGASGDEGRNEVLMILDEASALGGLASVEEALVRGRSAGVRLLLAYQSDSQVRTAFKDKPMLVYDNCAAQIHMGGASSYEAAERLSKSLGDWTQCVDSFSTTGGRSWTSNSSSSGPSAQVSNSSSTQVSNSSTQSYAVSGRALMRPDEILRLGEQYVIALLRGMPPILARRIQWYRDPAFRHAASLREVVLATLVAAAVGGLAWAANGESWDFSHLLHIFKGANP